jgi:hypothetical protein
VPGSHPGRVYPCILLSMTKLGVRLSHTPQVPLYHDTKTSTCSTLHSNNPPFFGLGPLFIASCTLCMTQHPKSWQSVFSRPLYSLLASANMDPSHLYSHSTFPYLRISPAHDHSLMAELLQHICRRSLHVLNDQNSSLAENIGFSPRFRKTWRMRTRSQSACPYDRQ